MRAYRHTDIQTYTRTHTHTRTHAHMHTCTHAHTHTCTHAHMHTCAHAHIHTCTHAHMHTCTHAHTHTHTHIHIHIYIHIRMHIHTVALVPTDLHRPLLLHCFTIVSPLFCIRHPRDGSGVAGGRSSLRKQTCKVQSAKRGIAAGLAVVRDDGVQYEKYKE